MRGPHPSTSMLPPAEDEQSEQELPLPLGISDWGDGEGGPSAGGGLGDTELASVVAQIAELAQLGLGDADRMYPQTMAEYFEAVADEQAWRVVL